jgi:predicted N-acetyltransferase YhbS
MKIIYLPRDENIIRTLATWIYNEWLQSNPNASVERMVSILFTRADSIRVPLTVVALSEQGVPIGVGNLTEADMKTRADLSPWMSGLYVSPEARGKGVGSALCRRIEQEAVRLGVPKIFLFTKDQQSLYSRLGWKTISEEKYDGIDVSVMELSLL